MGYLMIARDGCRAAGHSHPAASLKLMFRPFPNLQVVKALFRVSDLRILLKEKTSGLGGLSW